MLVRMVAKQYPACILELLNGVVALDAKTVASERLCDAIVRSAQGVLGSGLEDILLAAWLPSFSSILTDDDLLAIVPATTERWAVIPVVPHRGPVACIGDTFSMVAPLVARTTSFVGALTCAIHTLASEQGIRFLALTTGKITCTDSTVFSYLAATHFVLHDLGCLRALPCVDMVLTSGLAVVRP